MNTVKFVNHINSERQFELFLARDAKKGLVSCAHIRLSKDYPWDCKL